MLNNDHRSGAARAGIATVVALVLAAAAACDSLLDVTDPDVTLPESLEDPANLPFLYAGAIGDFVLGFSGQGTNVEALVASVGLFTDELYHSGTFGTRRQVDKRSIVETNAGMTTVFHNLHRGRRAVEYAARGFEMHEPNTARHAELLNLSGYSYLFFAENFCSGVPFSHITPENRFEFGEPLPTSAMYDKAMAYFEQAAAAATAAGSAAQASLARVGRARALLGMDRIDDAAALAREVPSGFAYRLLHSENTARQNNGLWAVSHNTKRYAVAHLEGGNGLPFRAGDPRVPFDPNPVAGIDAPYAHFYQLAYPARNTEVVLASGTEARLIEAEAALRAGDVAGFATLHTQLRAAAGLGPIDAAAVLAMTQAQREDLHFRERAHWLFLTAQRLADLRRLVRQYGRSPDHVFPSGAYSRLSSPAAANPLVPVVDGVYGSDVNFIIPFNEANNPNFVGCLNRDA